MSGLYFMSDSDTLTRETAHAMATVYSDLMHDFPESHNKRAVFSNFTDNSRVNVILSSGGGGGPFSPSFVTSRDLADVCINGNVSTAPSAYDIYEAAKKLDAKKGYLLLYNNFSGDNLNNDLAAELITTEGYPCRQVAISDDIFSADKKDERVGLVGILMALKAASACARRGGTLDEVAEAAQKVNQRMVSVLCTLDFKEKVFSIGEGIAGEEAPIRIENRFTVEDIAEISYDILMKELKPTENEKLFCFVSRCGRAKSEDAYILAQRFHDIAENGHPIEMMSCGYFDFFSEADSFGITVVAADEELAPLLSHRCFTDCFIL